MNDLKDLSCNHFEFLEYLPVAGLIADRETKEIVGYNKLFQRLTGYSSEDKGEVSLPQLFDIDKRGDLESGMVIKLVLKNGGSLNVLVYSREFSYKEESWIMATLSDISMIKYNGSYLPVSNLDDSRLDPMTGAYNYKAGFNILEEFLKDKTAATTICYIDINGLKKVNDFLGLEAGDGYINTIVDIIKAGIRKTDIFARMGGDEFLLLFPKCRFNVVEDIMGTIVNKLNVINETSNLPYKASISFGISELDGHTFPTADEALEDAVKKMREMKKEYNNQ